MTPVVVVIDSDICDGHGRCAELLPDVFELDDEAYGRVRNDAADVDPAVLQRVAALCPVGAIQVIVDE